MEMTNGILAYLLRWKKGAEVQELFPEEAASRPIRRLRCAPAGGGPKAGSGPEAGTLEKGQEKRDWVLMLTAEEDGPLEPALWVGGLGEAENVREQAEMLWQEALRWDSQMAQGILERKPAETVLEMGRAYIGHPYTLIDSELNVMYATAGYWEVPWKEPLPHGGERRRRLSGEATQTLLLRKDFHEAAQKTEGFYFQMHEPEIPLYCRNVLIQGQYFARLLLRLNPEEPRVCAGEEQLVERFGRYLEWMFQNELPSLGRHAHDALHRLCQALYAGEHPDAAILQMAANPYHWYISQPFLALVLRPYRQEGWQTQLEIVLPFLVRELEGQWPDSCAIVAGDKILWLVNMSRISREAFFSSFSVFIREHVCQAGVSAVFSDISQLRMAAAEAEAALRLGSQIRPSFWYFLFEDCRLAYCLEAVQRELPPERLIHPAVRKLREWDAKKGTEYLPTLKAYLDCRMNMTQAAERLYIHRTTFCRRMDQIHRLTGFYDAGPEQLLEIGLSFPLL